MFALTFLVVIYCRAKYLNAGCTGPLLSANVTTVTTCTGGTAAGTCVGTSAIICPLPGSVFGNQFAPTAKPTVAVGSPTMTPTVAAITVLKATQVEPPSQPISICPFY